MSGSIDDVKPEEWDSIFKKMSEVADNMNDVGCSSVMIREDEYDEYFADAPTLTADNVNNPPHYNTGNIECITAIESALSAEEYKGYLRGAALKYVWRCRYKGKAVEDLEKAQWYISRLCEALKNDK